jgi:hypothetical protein
MESLIFVLVVIGALLVIASGVWVAVALFEVISPGRGPVDKPPTLPDTRQAGKTQNHKPI